MSTKIYDGLRFKKKFGSAANLYKHILLFKEQATKFADELAAKTLIRCSQNLTIDYLFYGNKVILDTFDEAKKSIDFSLSPAYNMMLMVMENGQKIKNCDHSSMLSVLDFSFSICFYVVSSGRVLAIPFSKRREIRDYISGHEFFTEYHYQDNTDPPYHNFKKGEKGYCSPQEWRQRRKDWGILEYGEPCINKALMIESSNDGLLTMFSKRQPYSWDIVAYDCALYHCLEEAYKNYPQNKLEETSGSRWRQLSTYRQKLLADKDFMSIVMAQKYAILNVVKDIDIYSTRFKDMIEVE